MKLKGIKEACSLTKSYCREDGRGEQVAIWREGEQVYTKVIPNGWWLTFDDGEAPDALFYATAPMTMKQIEKVMNGEELD